MKKDLFQIKSIYFKSLLLLLIFSFITGFRFDYFDKLFYFDVLMIVYILSTFFIKKGVWVSKFTFNFIKILLIILLPSIVLINFTSDVASSLSFFIQYMFLIVILPLFLESVYKTKQYDFFLKSLLFALIVNSLLFLLKYFEVVGQMYFPEDFGFRFALGEFTPNEMGHYLILMLFLITVFISSRFKTLVELIGIIPFVLTLSKTVWVQLSVYLIVKKTKIMLIAFVLMFLALYFSGYLSVVYETMIFIHQDFSPTTTSNTIRLEMMRNAFSSIPSTILFPGYHSTLNLDTSLSVHNGILSYIVNFGLISFILLVFISSFFIFKNIKNKYFRFILFFIFLDFITLIFNPIINSRIVWLPLFIYIYTYHYKKDEYV